jgi:hypothetical protein
LLRRCRFFSKSFDFPTTALFVCGYVFVLQKAERNQSPPPYNLLVRTSYTQLVTLLSPPLPVVALLLMHRSFMTMAIVFQLWFLTVDNLCQSNEHDQISRPLSDNVPIILLYGLLTRQTFKCSFGKYVFLCTIRLVLHNLFVHRSLVLTVYTLEKTVISDVLSTVVHPNRCWITYRQQLLTRTASNKCPNYQ